MDLHPLPEIVERACAGTGPGEFGQSAGTRPGLPFEIEPREDGFRPDARLQAQDALAVAFRKTVVRIV